MKFSMKDLKRNAIGLSAVLATAPMATVAYAAEAEIPENSATADKIVGKVVGLILKLFMYLGLILLAFSIGLLAMAFKNEDGDSKSRAGMLLVVAIVLIVLKPIVGGVLDATGVDIDLG